MRRSLITLTLIASLLLVAPLAAGADPFQRPSMVKKSFRHLEWNFGLGLGASLFSTEHDTGVFFEDGDYSQERSTGIAGGMSFGYGVAKELIIGIEGQYWSESFSGEDSEEKWGVLTGVTTIQWFPGSVGLNFKGGFGVTYAAGDLEEPSGDYLCDEFHDTGIVLQGGVGYEFRLPMQDTVLTFGPQVDYVYLPLKDDLKATAITIKLQFRWYTSERKLDQYFRYDGG